MKRNYTGVFFPDARPEGAHMTWVYGFPLEYPEGVQPGDKAELTAVGRYEDDEVGCIVVTWNGHSKQPKEDRLLHVTFKCVEGCSPVQSGIRATEKGYTEIEPQILEGVWE